MKIAMFRIRILINFTKGLINPASFQQWLGAEYDTSHYLKQFLLLLLAHTITRHTNELWSVATPHNRRYVALSVDNNS